MVDRVEKLLRRLSPQEQRAIKIILKRIKSGRVADLDVKKLKGTKSIYRVRKGSLRVIYSIGEQGTIKILALERRSDTTYGKY